MDTLHNGYRSLSLLVNLNWDRLLYVFTIILALYCGAWLGAN